MLTRREWLGQTSGGILALAAGQRSELTAAEASLASRPWVEIRGIYGGFPDALLKEGRTPADFGVNAIWVGSGGLNREQIDRYHQLGLKVFAEFNSMHHAGFLKDHPDAAPIGVDGRPCPPPEGWQGVSPFHAGYRRNRMEEFSRILKTFDIDGIWLDYHHSHASWERAEPVMPDTDFCEAARRQFTQSTGIRLPAEASEAAKLLLGEHRDRWTAFRCDVFTDWVREYREILNSVRPAALLGTFHCPWSLSDFDGAVRHKLSIDLAAQAKFLDVFSIMPYHARFAHPQDPGWISRQTADLGRQLGIEGTSTEKKKIWPIVQLADWGERVEVPQIQEVIDHGTRRPATGVMVFHWSGVSSQPAKIAAMAASYGTIAGR